MELTKSNIKKTLENVNISGSSENIVSSGILKNIQVFGDQVDIDLILSNPTLQARKKLEVDIMKIIHADIYEKAKITINVKIEKVDSKISSQSKKISGVDSIIAVSSAKGGVGKSTVSSNLAVALANKGKKIGLLDADIYGPSQPRMMGVSQRPKSPDGKKIIPLKAHGVTMMSIGLMVDPSKAVVWRGPMLMGALQQMLSQVEWGELDGLLVDLPPGPGDVQLTLCQKAELSGAMIVSTPQEVALLDARKAIDMFKTLKTPIVGMIENMSNFVCPKCNHETPIFGNGGVLMEAEELKVPLLGTLPIDIDTRLAGDNGKPVALLGGAAATAYNKIADGFIASGLV